MFATQACVLGHGCRAPGMNTTVAVKIVGEKGSTGKEKKGFALSVPTIFVWDCSFNLMQMQEQYNVRKIYISLCFVEHQKTAVSRRQHENHENFPCSPVFDL